MRLFGDHISFEKHFVGLERMVKFKEDGQVVRMIGHSQLFELFSKHL